MATENVVKESTEQLTSSISGMTDWATSNTDLFIQYGVNILLAIVILIVGNMIIKLITNGVAKVLNKKNLDQVVVDFITTFIRYILFVIVFIAALGQVGVQTASVVAILGAIGLAVGLALQGSLANFAAGVLLVIFRPFKAGDYVEIAGVSGSVESIQIFQTVLTTPDNKMIVVPNGSVISGAIVNYSKHATRRIDYVIGVSYNADLQKTKQVLANVLKEETRLLETPEPTIGVVELADSSVNLVVRPWVRTADYWGVYFDLLQAMKEALDKEGIEIPFPQMDVHVNKLGD